MADKTTTVTVEESGDGPYAQNVRGAHHFITADAAPESGGTKSGAEPYELLLAALGACTSITVRMYAARKAWPLEHVGVTLSHRKEDGRDIIDRVLVFKGDLDDSQRARLLEIAGKCPVHKTLEAGAHIGTRME